MRSMNRSAVRPELVLTLLVAGIACNSGDRTVSDSAAAAAAADTVVAKCVGDNAGLTLPAGICATVFADSIGQAPHIAVASNGDVYVTLEGTEPKGKPQPAAVIALRDTTGDGRADVTAKIGTTGNTGI